jgi:peroxiredoxin
MKRTILSLLILLSSSLLLAQGYSINLTLKPYKNTYVYLGYYYGSKKALADSVLLDANSNGVFKGKQRLPGGIYFIVSPRKEILFELLLDQQQQFSISADSAKIPAGVVFTGSADNTVFQKYTAFANRTGEEATRLNASITPDTKPKEAEATKQRLKQLGDQLQVFRDSIENKSPNSILTALFKAMKEPIVPPASKHPGGVYDSNYAYQYYKSHFWDGVEWTDERLVRTPFFEPKLIRYYKELVAPHPDSLIKEVDKMILYSRSNKEMYKYLMVHFVQKYINPEYMGQDAVFVHLFEKYINTNQTDFFTAQYKEFMTKRAYSLMANLIGSPAANLEMVDSVGKPTNLYDINADMVVLCFWDPTCSHCKETVPRLDSIFHAKWKKQGVVLYGVMTDGGKDNWVNFIKEKNLKDWYHVYQLPSKEVENNAAGKPSYKQLYDVFQTPILYLLDKDKRIVAKKLSFEQLNEVIDLKIKKSTSN